MEREASFAAAKPYRFGWAIPFFLVHVACLAVFFCPFAWKWVALMAATYFVRMFGVTAGYHRYFSHRSYKLNRVLQFSLAVLAQTSAQKSVLWWAAHHRFHHGHADEEDDIHSPGLRGIWWAHVGWVLSNDYDGYDPRMIQDFAKFPELRWLDKYQYLPPIALAAVILAFGGWSAFVWGFLVSTVLLLHLTFCINSLAHLWGTRRFDTPDRSRNNFVLAIFTLGEGWHNNHHRFMYACRQGLKWWEIDITYYILKILSFVGITRELREIRLRPEHEGQGGV